MSKFRRRLRYRFDNVLSRGTWAVLLWLGIATLLTVLLSSLLLTIFDVTLAGSEDTSWFEDFWQSLLRTIDPGTMASDVGWGRRVLALVVTLFGVLIAGTLIGIIASGVEQRIEAMQRGRSAVVESDHVVILGASSRLPALIEQLALAGRGRRRNVIVVLTDQAPTELSHQVRSATPNLHGSHLVFRWGDPTNVGDLEIVALREARAIIVLDDDIPGNAGVVRAVLAVQVALGGSATMPVVAEVHDPQVGRDLVAACGGWVHPITPDQAIARLATYAFRGPHLIRVVQDLLDFGGPDLYVRDPLDLVGSTFGEAALAFEDARPIGLVDDAGGVVLGPDATTVIESTHRLVVIADGDGPPVSTRRERDLSDTAITNTVRPTPVVRLARDVEQRPQHVLIVGWSALAQQLVEQLDDTATAGSSATIVFDPAVLGDAPDPDCDRLHVTVLPKKAGAVRLDDLDGEGGGLTAILLVAYRDGLTADEADSRTMLIRQVLRRDLVARGIDASVLIELRDASNVELVAPIGPDDFVISDALVSSMIAQLAEQPERRSVLLRLYTDQRPGIGSVEAASLGLLGPTTFHEIARRTYEAGMIAIGWNSAPDREDTVRLNPRASEHVDVTAGDRIVVIG